MALFAVIKLESTLGVDYFETFSPIFKLSIVRVITNLAVTFVFDLQQINYQQCLLYGDLQEAIYMV